VFSRKSVDAFIASHTQGFSLRYLKSVTFFDDPSCNDFRVHHNRAPPVLTWPEQWRDEDICRVLELVPENKLRAFWYVQYTRLLL
jgi:hypothetical protein